MHLSDAIPGPMVVRLCPLESSQMRKRDNDIITMQYSKISKRETWPEGSVIVAAIRNPRESLCGVKMLELSLE